jgi:hypothetical protein
MFLLLCALLPAAHAFESADEALEGHDSPYSNWVAHVLKHWPASRPQPSESASLKMTCISTPSDDGYVGMLQQMIINAPLAVVEDVLDDIPHYKDIFPGVVNAHVLHGSSTGSRFVTAWEQRVPVFFLPNVNFELAHFVDKTVAGVHAYRYKLRKGGAVVASDGIAVLESLGANVTRFTAYDFLNAHWGPLPSSAVWRENLRGTFMTDIAIRLRAENPGWSGKRVADESTRLTEGEAEELGRCFKDRRPAEPRSALEPSARRGKEVGNPDGR